MASIISYRKYIDSQISRTLRLPEDVNHSALGTELATIDGETYVSLPDGVALPANQPAEIAASIKTIALNETLRAAIKEASPHTKLISARMIEQIRARYSIDDEMFFARIGIGQASGMYDASVGELAQIAEFGKFAEAVREWGRSERAKLGL